MEELEMSEKTKKVLEAISFIAFMLVLLLGVAESVVSQNEASDYWIGMIHGVGFVFVAILIACIAYAIAAWHFSEKKEVGS